MMHKTVGKLSDTQASSFRILDVRVTRNPMYPTRYQWRALESGGRIVETSTQTYATDREALRDGNAAARKIRRTGQRVPTILDPRTGLSVTVETKLRG